MNDGQRYPRPCPPVAQEYRDRGQGIGCLLTLTTLAIAGTGMAIALRDAEAADTLRREQEAGDA